MNKKLSNFVSKINLSDFVNKFIDNLKIHSKINLTNDNIILSALVLYIAFLSLYTPRHIVSLVNHPLSKILILGLIIYYGKDNLMLALVMSIALLVTINLDNSIAISEHKLGKITENFSSNSTDDDEDFEKDYDESKDIDSKGHSEMDNDDNNENFDTDSNDSSSDDEDTDSQSDEDQDKSDTDEDLSDNSDIEEEFESEGDDDESSDEEFGDMGFYDEGFDVKKIKPAKNLDDSFTKLHGAIHELEQYISKEKKK